MEAELLVSGSLCLHGFPKLNKAFSTEVGVTLEHKLAKAQRYPAIRSKVIMGLGQRMELLKADRAGS